MRQKPSAIGQIKEGRDVVSGNYCDSQPIFWLLHFFCRRLDMTCEEAFELKINLLHRRACRAL